MRVEGPLPAVTGDRERVIQLLCQPGRQRPQVQQERPPGSGVRGARRPDANGFATLFVRDNGIGIAPQYHEQIFRMFRRLHRREEFGAPVRGWRFARRSSRRTAAASGWSRSPATARRFISRCRATATPSDSTALNRSSACLPDDRAAPGGKRRGEPARLACLNFGG